MEQQNKIKQLIRIFGDSGSFARLWEFYHKYIPIDEELLSFFWDNLKNHATFEESVENAYSDKPQRLMNRLPLFYSVERFIEKTELIHNVCPNDESFVVILWISMIESFQDSAASCNNKYKTWKSGKGETRSKIRAFFEKIPNSINEKLLMNIDFHDKCCPMNKNKKYFSIQDFADWLYFIRNYAVHSGQYSNPIFNNDKESRQMVYGKTNRNKDCNNLTKENYCLEEKWCKGNCTWNSSYISTTLSYHEIKNAIVAIAIDKIKNIS